MNYCVYLLHPETHLRVAVMLSRTQGDTSRPQSVCLLLYILQYSEAGIEFSIKWLATGWTVWSSKPVGDEIFGARPDRPLSPISLLFPKGKAAVSVVLTIYHLLAPKFKMGRIICLSNAPPPPPNVLIKCRLDLPYLYSSLLWSVTDHLLVLNTCIKNEWSDLSTVPLYRLGCWLEKLYFYFY